MRKPLLCLVHDEPLSCTCSDRCRLCGHPATDELGIGLCDYHEAVFATFDEDDDDGESDEFDEEEAARWDEFIEWLLNSP